MAGVDTGAGGRANISLRRPRWAQRLVISLLMSCCHWRTAIPHRGPDNTPTQMPSVPAFHLHSNRDVWVNRQQAPNLLPGLRGQDETGEMARGRHRGANSSGSVGRARKLLLRSDGKCFRSIRDKAAIRIQVIYAHI